MWAPRIWKIGVTGGIGAGKSNIARIIGNCGVPVIDADKLGHKTYEPGTETFNHLTTTFGSSIIDENGQINRRALGAQGMFYQFNHNPHTVVFGNPEKMKQLTY